MPDLLFPGALGDQKAAATASGGSTSKRDCPADHQKKAGTPTMARRADSLFHYSFHCSLDEPEHVRLDCSGLYAGVRGNRLHGRLLEADEKAKSRVPARKPSSFFKSWSPWPPGALVYTTPEFSAKIAVPFFKNFQPNLGWGYIPFAVLVIVGASNAVNLTDGLDGLAIGPVIIASATYMLFAYAGGNTKIANYLQIPYVAGVGEITIFCSAVAGAGMGFLWFNAYPAQMFMGDTGSLSLGAALGSAAVITKQEVLLVIVGGLFVIEALSVIFQVGFFKMTHGKRIFRMAPLHHHFELKGWEEPKVCVRFWDHRHHSGIGLLEHIEIEVGDARRIAWI